MTEQKPTRVRHTILGMVVLVYFITYLDRVLLSNALPKIQKDFGFDLITLGLIQSCYQWAYALFQIPGGWFGDRMGPRVALASVVLWWSVLTFITGFSASVTMLMVCLFLIGMGEAGAFPIANRALSRWMLPGERGFAQGATHAGSRLAGALTPVLVAALIAQYTWHMPFFLFGAVGIVWAVVWFWYYRDVPAEHASVNAGERDKIVAALGSPKGRPPIPWKMILSSRQMWTVAAMYFCYGYALNVFLAYFPKYLEAERHYSAADIGLFASLPLAFGVVGDILGGVISDAIIHRTGRIKFARQSVAIVGFLIAAVCCPLAVWQQDRLISALLFGLTVFGLELVVGNAWAVTLDIGGSFAGSCSAVMNFVGNLGGAIMATVTVFIVKYAGWPMAFYVVAGLSVLGALLFSQIDAGRKLAPDSTSPVV